MESPSSDIRFAVTDGVARLTIDREAQRNALSWDAIAALRALVAQARTDPAVRVVVLTGAGDRAFCAGADLGGMATGPDTDPAETHAARGELAGLFTDLWALGKPTIARVRGYALAGGFGLALACDLVVAADDAVFGTPEVDVGLWVRAGAVSVWNCAGAFSDGPGMPPVRAMIRAITKASAMIPKNQDIHSKPTSTP